jgi:gamma-polyglutamate biosynthesis protein CapA
MQFKIVSIGDYMTGENAHHFRRGIATKFRNRYNELISEDVKEVLADGDYLFLNFESSLANEEKLSTLPINDSVYVAPLETIQLLKQLNIPVITNVANNHFAQHGKDVCRYTIDKLESNGIYVIGKSNKPLKLSVEGITLAIWGVSLIKDNASENSYFKSNYRDLLHDLQLQEKAQDEYRIISIHWGSEYHTLENNQQRELARNLSNSGFDLILGHHPHTIQPVEKINNTWVCYSHGNFLFDQNFSSITQQGLITKITMPENQMTLFLSQQKNYRVVRFLQITLEELKRYCLKNFSNSKPMIMRIKMKLELLTHFYELNLSTIKLFFNRFFKLIK